MWVKVIVIFEFVVCLQLKSDKSEDSSDRSVCEVGCWAPRAKEGANERNDHNKDKLAPGEERLYTRVQE